MHNRSEIRAALVALLIGEDLTDPLNPVYATSVMDKVYSNRAYNVQAEECPVIIIRDGSESAIPRDIRSTVYQRTWTVKIEVKVESATAETDLDTILEQIETAMNSDRKLSGKASSVAYLGIDEPEFDSSGSVTIGKTAINYEIKYLS